jgi:hypothetical protein
MVCVCVGGVCVPTIGPAIRISRGAGGEGYDIPVLESNNITRLELVGRVKFDNHEDGSSLVGDSIGGDSHAVHPGLEVD